MRTPAERVERITREVDGVWSLSDIDSWEQTFLRSIVDRRDLTPKQEETLRGIELKVFGEEYDPHTGDLF